MKKENQSESIIQSVRIGSDELSGEVRSGSLQSLSIILILILILDRLLGFPAVTLRLPLLRCLADMIQHKHAHTRPIDSHDSRQPPQKRRRRRSTRRPRFLPHFDCPSLADKQFFASLCAPAPVADDWPAASPSDADDAADPSSEPLLPWAARHFNTIKHTNHKPLQAQQTSAQPPPMPRLVKTRPHQQTPTLTASQPPPSQPRPRPQPQPQPKPLLLKARTQTTQIKEKAGELHAPSRAAIVPISSAVPVSSCGVVYSRFTIRHEDDDQRLAAMAFEARQQDTMANAFDEFVSELALRPDRVAFMWAGRRLCRSDSPASLAFSEAPSRPAIVCVSKVDFTITLKGSAQQRDRKKYWIRPTESFESAFIDWSSSYSLSPADVIFLYRGQRVQPDNTPMQIRMKHNSDIIGTMEEEIIEDNEADKRETSWLPRSHSHSQSQSHSSSDSPSGSG